MKWEARSNFILACRLHRRELWNLLVKDIRWKDARLYVFVRKILIGDSLGVDERLIPVVPGQEHAILYLSVMRDPNEWVFISFHIPLHCTLYTLRRHYTQAFNRFLAPDRTLPAPNKQQFTSPNDYDEAAAMEVAKAMGCSHLDFDIVVRTYICGRNTPSAYGH